MDKVQITHEFGLKPGDAFTVGMEVDGKMRSCRLESLTTNEATLAVLVGAQKYQLLRVYQPKDYDCKLRANPTSVDLDAWDTPQAVQVGLHPMDPKDLVIAILKGREMELSFEPGKAKPLWLLPANYEAEPWEIDTTGLANITQHSYRLNGQAATRPWKDLARIVQGHHSRHFDWIPPTRKP